MTKITYFERSRLANRFSIERLFNSVRHGLPDHAEFEVLNCPQHGTHPWTLLRNLLFAFRNRGAINHITGDVHYLALALPSKKTVLTIHDTVGVVQSKGWKRWLIRKLWYEWPIRKSAVVTVISAQAKKEVLELLGSAANAIEPRIVVVPNCVAADYFTETTSPNNSPPVILQIGTKWNKNLETVAKAIENKSLALRIMGVPTRQQVKMLDGLKINYSATGPLSDDQVICEYQKSDIVCFASLYEGFGLPILEAQAIGRPLITSRLEPMSVVAGKGARLVNPESSEEISSAIDEILQSVELRKELLQSGKQNVVKYTEQEVAGLYFQIYQNIESRNAQNGTA